MRWESSPQQLGTGVDNWSQKMSRSSSFGSARRDIGAGGGLVLLVGLRKSSNGSGVGVTEPPSTRVIIRDHNASEGPGGTRILADDHCRYLRIDNGRWFSVFYYPLDMMLRILCVILLVVSKIVDLAREEVFLAHSSLIVSHKRATGGALALIFSVHASKRSTPGQLCGAHLWPDSFCWFKLTGLGNSELGHLDQPSPTPRVSIWSNHR